VNDPFEVPDADYLFVESTYGGRLHRKFEESKAELLEAIQYAVSNNQKVIIPAFALERTQEVLYLLGEFSRARKLPEIPIYLDSPLQSRQTEIFRKNKKYYDEAARAIVGQGFDPFDMPNLRLTPTTMESMKINREEGPAIVIFRQRNVHRGSDQASPEAQLVASGRKHHFRRIPAEGTTGRQIVDGVKTVTIFGEKIAVRAKVFTIGGFSLTPTRRTSSGGSVILRKNPDPVYSPFTGSRRHARRWRQRSESDSAWMSTCRSVVRS